MKVYVTRTSVCAGDDVDAPHNTTLSLSDDFTLDDIVWAIQQARYLPNIDGGQATWSVASGIPIAVMTQQWLEPRMLTSLDFVKDKLDIVDRTIRVHVNYHAQTDPQIVWKVLRELQLWAI
jgi:hypothetical protein